MVSTGGIETYSKKYSISNRRQPNFPGIFTSKIRIGCSFDFVHGIVANALSSERSPYGFVTTETSRCGEMGSKHTVSTGNESQYFGSAILGEFGIRYTINGPSDTQAVALGRVCLLI